MVAPEKFVIFVLAIDFLGHVFLSKRNSTIVETTVTYSTLELPEMKKYVKKKTMGAFIFHSQCFANEYVV